MLADIGIPEAVVAAHDQGLRQNDPGLWRHLLPVRVPDSHKYRFGHALIFGGPASATGASRLAARAALRIGAGLVSIAVSPDALPVYASQLTAVMTKPVADISASATLLADARFTAVLIGPGAGVGASTREAVAAILATRGPAVLDADALTSFSSCRAALLRSLHAGCVLTPHDGEYARLFEHRGDRLARALAASREAGAVVLLKGADTVVAAPDGRAAIQPDAPAELASAGTGDVLGGMIFGLLAAGMPAFEAAAAGTWLHAAAARGAGPGLIAEDLSERLPAVLAALA